ncbi:hypothetical protein SLE2022_190760 [Rubroshorea leprosula]
MPLVTAGVYFSLDNTTSFETLHRLNVGGDSIGNVKDTGMHRTWSQDGDYFVGLNWTSPILNKSQPLHFDNIPAYTAPQEVLHYFAYDEQQCFVEFEIQLNLEVLC